MSNELNLPLTEDGKGYQKEAVQELIAVEQDKARRLVEQAEILLAEAENRSKELVDEATSRKEHLVAEADALVAEKTEGLDTIREDLLSETNAYVNNLRSSVEKESKKKINEAERKASNIIEEAMSKVHALVKTAQGKLETAKRESAQLRSQSLDEYSNATAKAGLLVAEAEAFANREVAEANEEAIKMRLDGETMIAYAHEESRLQLVAARTESERIIAEASAYREQVGEWAEKELESARNSIEQYKAFYDDNVSRMVALYATNLDVARQLSAVNFPDGSNLQIDPSYATQETPEEESIQEEGAQTEDGSVDESDAVVPSEPKVELDEEEPETVVQLEAIDLDDINFVFGEDDDNEETTDRLSDEEVGEIDELFAELDSMANEEDETENVIVLGTDEDEPNSISLDDNSEDK